MSPTPATVSVIGGVDTHKHTHYAAAVDHQGRLLGYQEFPANDAGYASLLTWMLGHGHLEAIGVESTGSFGATLTRRVNPPATTAHRVDQRTGDLEGQNAPLDLARIWHERISGVQNIPLTRGFAVGATGLETVRFTLQAMHGLIA